VPSEAAPLFLQLALTTTFKRGPETIPPGAYEITISHVDPPILTNPIIKTDPITGIPIHKFPKAHPDLQTVVLTFDKPIPSGDATMVAKLLDGRTIRIHFDAILKTKDDQGKEEEIVPGSPTIKLKTQAWSPSSKGYTENDLLGAKGRLYSHDFPADAPVPSAPPLQKVNANLNYLRNLQSQGRRIP
jgi:hypothetical protein